MYQNIRSNAISYERYYYETPKWAVRLLCLLALVISLLCFFSFIYLIGHDSGKDLYLKVTLFAMAIGFAVAGGKPRNWRPWVYFYADSKGFHFPSNCPANSKTKWLNVPWKNIGGIKKSKLSGGATGVLLELLINSEEIDQFFKDVKITQSIYGSKSTAPYFTVGYANSFKNTDQAVEILNSMKQIYQ